MSNAEKHPLPNSRRLLEVFAAGSMRPPHPLILNVAHDLVSLQRSYLLAIIELGVSEHRRGTVRFAIDTLRAVARDIDEKVAQIDSAVMERFCRSDIEVLAEDARLADSNTPVAPLHTESLGTVISRMAQLYVAVTANHAASGPLPESA
ncbi:hypothetical protein ACWCW7_36005, partial [Nocardia tengchongensis]